MTVSQAWLNAVRVMNTTLIRQLARIYAGKPLDGSEYAIHQAARQNRADIVEVLLPFEGGKQQSQEHTALMIAAQLGYLNVISVVLDAEKDVYTSTGVDALMLASSAGKLEVCKILLPAIGARDDYMMFTALHYAAASGHKDVCEYLLNESVYELGVIQASADIAQRNGHDSICDYLQLVADAAIRREQTQMQGEQKQEVPRECTKFTGDDDVQINKQHRVSQKSARRLFNGSLSITIPETPKGRIRYPTPKAELYPEKNVVQEKQLSNQPSKAASRFSSYAADNDQESSTPKAEVTELMELRKRISVLEKENLLLREKLAATGKASVVSLSTSSNTSSELQVEMENSRLLSEDLLRMYKENAVLQVKLSILKGSK
ncbi:Protein 21.1 [Giardia lamblia P15]|uniref:Protein 21.1 n=1 Tax=Giardia intestinalis (strain P15) TaxID=658858 RepID=E1F5F8_GIAIA|nr:Protein 21.1 [Giardia lamblia P15]